MSNVLPFTKKAKAKRSTLCQNNHHKWKAAKNSQFDVKQGKLVTIETCTVCGKVRHRLT